MSAASQLAKGLIMIATICVQTYRSKRIVPGVKWDRHGSPYGFCLSAAGFRHGIAIYRWHDPHPTTGGQGERRE